MRGIYQVGFRIAWIEEAQTLSHRSLSLLRPTIRTGTLAARATPIDDFLRAKKPDNATVVQANWRDNPWFPDVLNEERRLDFEIYPERNAHIWEGDYAKADSAVASCMPAVLKVEPTPNW
jgi:phage terminase large subunit